MTASTVPRHALALVLAAVAWSLPPSAEAAPSGVATVAVVGTERILAGDFAHAQTSLFERIDQDGDGVDDAVFDGHAEARWSFTGGALAIGGRVSLFGRDLPLWPTSFYTQAQVHYSDNVWVTAPFLPVAAPLSATLLFHIGGAAIDPWSRFTSESTPANWVAPRGAASVVAWAPGIDGGFLSSGPRDDDFLFEVTMSVLNQVPFDLSLDFYLEQAGQAVLASMLGHDNYSSSGELDFLHTLVFAGIRGVSATGPDLHELALVSSGGQAYLAMATPVPEPAAAALLLAGLVGMSARRRRRR